MKNKNVMSNRDFFGEDFYKKMLGDYEAIRVSRKNFKGKPDHYDRIIMDMNKAFEAFYKQFID